MAYGFLDKWSTLQQPFTTKIEIAYHKKRFATPTIAPGLGLGSRNEEM